MTELIITIAAIGVVIFFIFLKKKQDEVERSFQTRFSSQQILLLDKYALYVARKSDGRSHFRGVGYFALTEDELYFERQLDRKTFSIPTTKILNVSSTRRLAGQSPGQLMLKVEFKTDDGGEDAIAWRVKDLAQWLEQITRTVKNQR